MPCFVTDRSGSVAMNAIYGSDVPLDGEKILVHIEKAMCQKVDEILEASKKWGLNPTEAVLRLIEESTLSYLMTVNLIAI